MHVYEPQKKPSEIWTEEVVRAEKAIQGRRNRGGRGCLSPPKFQDGGAEPPHFPLTMHVH